MIQREKSEKRRSNSTQNYFALSDSLTSVYTALHKMQPPIRSPTTQLKASVTLLENVASSFSKSFCVPKSAVNPVSLSSSSLSS